MCANTASLRRLVLIARVCINATDGPLLIQNTFDQLGQTISNVLKNVLFIENYIKYNVYIRSDAQK